MKGSDSKSERSVMPARAFKSSHLRQRANRQDGPLALFLCQNPLEKPDFIGFLAFRYVPTFSNEIVQNHSNGYNSKTYRLFGTLCCSNPLKIRVFIKNLISFLSLSQRFFPKIFKFRERVRIQGEVSKRS